MAEKRKNKTLYAMLPAWTSRALIFAVAVLVILPAIPHTPLYIPGERHWGEIETGFTDKTLYRTIVLELERGGNYYQIAAAEHRAHNYPTSPPQVFRAPTLALLLATLRFHFLQLTILFALDGAIIFLFFRELLNTGKSFSTRVLAIVVATTGLSIAGIVDGVYVHEVWAALLIAISLLSYRATLWWPAILFGLLACLIREIALPYLFVMAAFALYERRRVEFIAWLGAMILFAAIFAVHITFARELYRRGDLVSPGWLGLGGWDFTIATAKWNIFLHMLPYPFVALAVCLGVIGLAGAYDDRARRAALVVSGYLIAFLVVGRPENYYWGILYTPLLSMGFLLAPAAVEDLFRIAFPSMLGFIKKISGA